VLKYIDNWPRFVLLIYSDRAKGCELFWDAGRTHLMQRNINVETAMWRTLFQFNCSPCRPENFLALIYREPPDPFDGFRSRLVL